MISPFYDLFLKSLEFESESWIRISLEVLKEPDLLYYKAGDRLAESIFIIPISVI
jgi:hypothetical protein